MYEFIEISKLVKFLTSLFVPAFSALLVISGARRFKEGR